MLFFYLLYTINYVSKIIIEGDVYIMKTLRVKRLSPTAILPQRAHDTDSGLDLFCDESVLVRAGNRALVHTNIAIELEPGYEGQVRSKSGLALNKGLMVLNSPGTIDAPYRGEVGVIIFNTTGGDVLIEKGTKIAQLVIQKVELPPVEEIDELSDTERGAGGFGSTGLTVSDDSVKEKK